MIIETPPPERGCHTFTGFQALNERIQRLRRRICFFLRPLHSLFRMSKLSLRLFFGLKMYSGTSIFLLLVSDKLFPFFFSKRYLPLLFAFERDFGKLFSKLIHCFKSVSRSECHHTADELIRTNVCFRFSYPERVSNWPKLQ